MVNEARVNIKSNQDTTQYDLIEVFISNVSEKPDQKHQVHARPYEFYGDQAAKYSSTCPHCGQEMFFNTEEIVTKYGRNFVGCKECGIGQSSDEIPVFEDPFINPIQEGKIDEQKLDPDLVNTLSNMENDGRSVADRMADKECEE